MEQIENTLDNFDSYRDLFPVIAEHIYLDHAGISPVSTRVKAAVNKFLDEASQHAGFHYERWGEDVQNVRSICARLVGANEHEIAFVKNTSHGVSIVSNGLDWKSGDNLIIPDFDFPSNIYPWLSLQRRGVEIRTFPFYKPGCRLEDLLEDLEALMDERTRLLSLSSVHFATGARPDLKTLGELCRARNIYFFVDAIQSLGVAPMDVREANIDFLAADGHKWLLAPEGTGLFYCRDGLAQLLEPPLLGWKSVKDDANYEHIDYDLKTTALRFEEASMNVMGIVAMGASIEMLLEVGIHNVFNKVAALGDMIISESESRGWEVRTPKSRERRGGIISVKGDFDPVHIKTKLYETGAMVNARGGGLRISPHFYNNSGDITGLFSALDKLNLR